MNTSLLNTIKGIVAENGETVLSDPRRVSAFLADLARNEPKPQKTVLVKCLEQGFAQVLRNASESKRDDCRQFLSRRMHEEEGLDLGLCAETVELLATVLFGEGINISSGHESSANYEMALVRGGSFQMGDTVGGGESDEQPVHTVTLSAFYIGKYEVTQSLYESITGSNPSGFRGGNLPVETVTWFDAVEFCNKLSVMEGLQPVYKISGRIPASGYPITSAEVAANREGNGYRLPTEAEWEYAAKGGNGSPGKYKYAGSNTVDDVAWYLNNGGSTTHEAGTKAPNGLGIYDMSGNVREWCWDWKGNYSSEAQVNPVGAPSGFFRIYRGGSWNIPAMNVRSAYRPSINPSFLSYFLGFRLVRGGL